MTEEVIVVESEFSIISTAQLEELWNRVKINAGLNGEQPNVAVFGHLVAMLARKMTLEELEEIEKEAE